MKRHPHTNAVEIASSRMTKVIDSFKGEPRFMQTTSDRTSKRHERLDSAAPDVQAWKSRLTMEQLERLAKLDTD